MGLRFSNNVLRFKHMPVFIRLKFFRCVLRRSQAVSWETKNIHRSPATKEPKFEQSGQDSNQEVSLFQQYQVSHFQMRTTIMALTTVEPWYKSHANKRPRIYNDEMKNGQTHVPVALTEGFMWNQGHVLKAHRPKSLSLNNQYKIRTTFLISAKWMTAIVRCRRKVSFSQIWSGYKTNLLRTQARLNASSSSSQ